VEGQWRGIRAGGFHGAAAASSQKQGLAGSRGRVPGHYACRGGGYEQDCTPRTGNLRTAVVLRGVAAGLPHGRKLLAAASGHRRVHAGTARRGDLGSAQGSPALLLEEFIDGCRPTSGWARGMVTGAGGDSRMV